MRAAEELVQDLTADPEPHREGEDGARRARLDALRAFNPADLASPTSCAGEEDVLAVGTWTDLRSPLPTVDSLPGAGGEDREDVRGRPADAGDAAASTRISSLVASYEADWTALEGTAPAARRTDASPTPVPLPARAAGWEVFHPPPHLSLIHI